jgi:xanthine dehydrogenase YagT iron-sulfur-binding subunit
MAKDQGDPNGKGLSRRDFMSTMGVGAVAVAMTAKAAQAAQPGEEQMVKAGEMVKVQLNINERGHTLLVEPRWSLLYAIREVIGLTGTKVGCERGECGSCTVLIDGVPRYACLTLAVEAEGHKITTLEGLMQGEELGPVQEAFLEKDGFQCGYCTPGQVMSAEGLLRKNPSPSPDEIRSGMSGNLCRCGAYPHIFESVALAADKKKM